MRPPSTSPAGREAGIRGERRAGARTWLPHLYPLLVVLAGALIYAGALHSQFVFDDVPSIRDNVLVRSLDNYLGSWSGYRQRLNRWVAYLTFALDYRLGGL